ncbi:hypothetical protein DICPUDRAFT_98608 [Dictyostelium purpureum]|uniref:SNF2-related domain-containing protein n=1 Tax=Dictyostelium purpureum TaxID=5786 RepID=F0ZS09_DICPU|nr:uncharacterized protein DICPUDRAFT_98608 [Dictyostelium purpureum]EGC33268.1 hypothetical protein DICPUDRAFT_98608 [Dictyostelium purpureum]|eukprot:XP_003290215.1 hypothetical protein DICPUDRAFT_98608 [Dictyostelium purpureum]
MTDCITIEDDSDDEFLRDNSKEFKYSTPTRYVDGFLVEENENEMEEYEKNNIEWSDDDKQIKHIYINNNNNNSTNGSNNNNNNNNKNCNDNVNKSIDLEEEISIVSVNNSNINNKPILNNKKRSNEDIVWVNNSSQLKLVTSPFSAKINSKNNNNDIQIVKINNVNNMNKHKIDEIRNASVNNSNNSYNNGNYNNNNNNNYKNINKLPSQSPVKAPKTTTTTTTTNTLSTISSNNNSRFYDLDFTAYQKIDDQNVKKIKDQYKKGAKIYYERSRIIDSDIVFELDKEEEEECQEIPNPNPEEIKKQIIQGRSNDDEFWYRQIDERLLKPHHFYSTNKTIKVEEDSENDDEDFSVFENSNGFRRILNFQIPEKWLLHVCHDQLIGIIYDSNYKKKRVKFGDEIFIKSCMGSLYVSLAREPKDTIGVLRSDEKKSTNYQSELHLLITAGFIKVNGKITEFSLDKCDIDIYLTHKNLLNDKVDKVKPGPNKSESSQRIDVLQQFLNKLFKSRLIYRDFQLDTDGTTEDVNGSIKGYNRTNDDKKVKKVLEKIQQPDFLRTSLLGFQREGIWWMLKRETHPYVTFSDAQDKYWFLYTTAKDEIPFYLNSFCDKITFFEPITKRRLYGGLNCDEVGLGKSIQSITLILTNHPEFSKNKYQERAYKDFEKQIANRSSHLKRSSMVNTNSKYLTKPKATLLICPSNLSEQWKGEMEKHIKPEIFNSLKIVIYKNAKRKEYTINDLLEADLVITSPETFTIEYRVFEQAIRGGTSKNPSPPPLLSVHWWRVIIDEAHRFGKKTIFFRGIQNLDSINRWCLTATPTPNTVHDLYPMLHFLNCYPIAQNTKTWDEIVNRYQVAGVKEFVNPILITRNKNDSGVRQVKRHEEIVKLDFDKEEKMAYSLVFKESSEALKKIENKGGLMRHYALIFSLITRLRTCCDHITLVAPKISELEKEKVCNLCNDVTKDLLYSKCSHIYCQVCIDNIFSRCNSFLCERCDSTIYKNGFTKEIKVKVVEKSETEEMIELLNDVIPEGVKIKKIKNLTKKKKDDKEEQEFRKEKEELDKEILGSIERLMAQENIQRYQCRLYSTKIKALFEDIQNNMVDTNYSYIEDDHDDFQINKNSISNNNNSNNEIDEHSNDSYIIDDDDDDDEYKPLKSSISSESSESSTTRNRTKINNSFDELINSEDEEEFEKEFTINEPKKKKLKSKEKKVPTPKKKSQKQIEKERDEELSKLPLPEGKNQFKCLVFSQWTRFLDLIEECFKHNGWNLDEHYCRYDGKVPLKKRESIIKEFSRESGGPRVMLISLKCGGVGLNLHRANMVYMCDPYWNSAVEEQAIGRVDRLNQTRDLKIKRFVMRDTIEERIMALQDTKKINSNIILSDSFDTLEFIDNCRLSVEDIKALFRDFYINNMDNNNINNGTPRQTSPTIASSYNNNNKNNNHNINHNNFRYKSQDSTFNDEEISYLRESTPTKQTPTKQTPTKQTPTKQNISYRNINSSVNNNNNNNNHNREKQIVNID